MTQPYNPNSFQKVKEAIAWAYRQGYAGAEGAAKELAELLGEEAVKINLGTYGDAITWERSASMIRISVNPENIGHRVAEIGAGGKEYNVVEHNWPAEKPKTGHLRDVGVRPLGRDAYHYYECVDCGTLYPRIGWDIKCNGHAIVRCPYCCPTPNREERCAADVDAV